MRKINDENLRMLNRLQDIKSKYDVADLEKRRQEESVILNNISDYPFQLGPPRDQQSKKRLTSNSKVSKEYLARYNLHQINQLHNTSTDSGVETDAYTGKTRGKGFFSTKHSIEKMPSVMKSLDVTRHYNLRTPDSQIDFSKDAMKRANVNRLMDQVKKGVDIDFDTLEKLDEKSITKLQRGNIGLPSIVPHTSSNRLRSNLNEDSVNLTRSRQMN